MMNSKTKTILVSILLFTILCVFFYLFSFPYKLVIVFGFIVIVMEIALLEPPQKHHEFSDHDSKQAINNLMGLNIGTINSDEVGSEYLVEKIKNDTEHNQSAEKD